MARTPASPRSHPRELHPSEARAGFARSHQTPQASPQQREQRTEPGSEGSGGSQCEDRQCSHRVFGVSGQLMLDALLEGKATIEEVANLACHTARRKIPEIIQSLEGNRLDGDYRMLSVGVPVPGRRGAAGRSSSALSTSHFWSSNWRRLTPKSSCA